MDVVSEIAKHTVVPLLSLIARPFKPLWAYKENWEELENKEGQLRLETAELQESIVYLVQPPEDVSNWQDEVNTICNRDISRLREERGTLRGCSVYFNVKKSYTHRRTVAQKLKAADRLERRLQNSEDLWKYKIQIQNLKKKADDLTREEGKVKSKIKEGERPVSNVQNWMARVSTINPELQYLINRSPSPQEQSPDYSQLGVNVVHKLSVVEALLKEAEEFNEFSEETEETKYKKDLPRLKEQVEMLQRKEKDVLGRIKVDEEPTDSVIYWLGEVKKIVDEVNQLTAEYSPEKYNRVSTLSEETSRLLEQETQFTIVARQVPLDPINYQSPTFHGFQSRQSILEDVIEKLGKDDLKQL